MTNHILEHENKSLISILAHLKQIDELNRLFAQKIPEEIAKHCRVVKYDRDCLIVIVENGNWATQLRFLIPDLLTSLRLYPQLKNLSGICCKTRPSQAKRSRASTFRQIAKLSASTAAMVLETAKNIQDEKLKQVIERIAKRVKIEE